MTISRLAKRRKGGWHQNLYDENGRLRGSARFVPVDETEDEPTVITETVYVPIEERRKSKAQEELEQLAREAPEDILKIAIAAAESHVKRWLHEKAMPYVKTKIQNRRFPRRQSQFRAVETRDSSAQVATVTKSLSDASSTDVAVTSGRLLMSNAEAQARLLAAAAARAYSNEQLAVVINSQIIGEGDVNTIRMALAQLSPEQIVELVQYMASSPQLLEDANLADLASHLGKFRQVEGET